MSYNYVKYRTKASDRTEADKERYRAKRRAIKAQVNAVARAKKMESGCVDCGYKAHHVALDFDHITDGKVRDVCQAMNLTQLYSEMEKCEVVCSNCHRIRTYNRMKAARSAMMDDE